MHNDTTIPSQLGPADTMPSQLGPADGASRRRRPEQGSVLPRYLWLGLLVAGGILLLVQVLNR
jgi:hypothetical protein